MWKSIIKILLVAVVIAGLVLPLLNLRAEEIKTQKTETLKEVNGLVSDLINLKDNNDLSAEEKALGETRIRKEALKKIFDLFLLEISDLQNKLNELDLQDQQLVDIRTRTLALLQGYTEHSQELTQQLDNNLTLEGLKGLARDFKIWRETYYNPQIQILVDFLLVFGEKSALKTANTRLDKIIADLKKLENTKLIRNSDYTPNLAKAMDTLTNAYVFNQRAEKMILEKIIRNQLLSTTTSPTVLFAMSPATSTNATSSSKVLTNADEIKSLIERSIQEIKNTYTQFLEISKTIKKKLSL